MHIVGLPIGLTAITFLNLVLKFFAIFVVLTFFKEPEKSVANTDDDKNNEDELDSFKSSKDRLEGHSASDIFSSRSCINIAIPSKCQFILKELYEFLKICFANIKKGEEHLVSNRVVLNNEPRNEERIGLREN